MMVDALSNAMPTNRRQLLYLPSNVMNENARVEETPTQASVAKGPCEHFLDGD